MPVWWPEALMVGSPVPFGQGVLNLMNRSEPYGLNWGVRVDAPSCLMSCLS